MSVIYSGQTIINTTVSGATNTTLNQAVSNTLTSAGWSLVKDGSSDGIWRLRTAQTPQSLQGDVWLWGISNASAVAAASVLSTTNTSSLLEATYSNLTVGAGFTYQLIAGAYYFYLFRTTNPMPVNQSYFFSVPFVPTNLSGLINELIVSYSTGSTDTLGNTGVFSTGTHNFALVNGAGRTGGQWNIYSISSYNKPTWFDTSCEFYEPRILAQQTSSSGTAVGSRYAMGYQWDALVINQPIPRNTTLSYDGGSWLSVTEGTDPGLIVKVA